MEGTVLDSNANSHDYATDSYIDLTVVNSLIKHLRMVNPATERLQMSSIRSIVLNAASRVLRAPDGSLLFSAPARAFRARGAQRLIVPAGAEAS
ncbi:MAG TPA: hypothetical protein VG963_06315, partial [Polyangiaceae bacterium]|nr:hypothetical protein [Polyangiaceae bacterium]